MRKKETSIKIKSTSFLSLPEIAEKDPVALAERRIRAFIENPDWVYDTLSVISKALNNVIVLNAFECLALERLDLISEVENGFLVIMDRYYNVLDKNILTSLKQQILSLTACYSSRLIREPELHHMKSLFKKALRKAPTKKLTAEETNVLKEAYLKLENGKVVNLRGELVNIPQFNFRTLLTA